MKKFIIISVSILFACSGSLYKGETVKQKVPVEMAPVMPMTVNYAESANTRWLKKPVLDSRLLDDMESTARWTLEGKGEMILTDEHMKDGSHSLRMQTKSKYTEDKIPENQRNYGTTSVTRRFDGEDWTQFNRISLWIFPDLQGWRIVTARIYLYNDGKIKIPGGFYPVYQAAQQMKNDGWNQIVWEITDLPREKVTGVKLEVRRQGNEADASDTITFDIDHLELQKVEPDQYEGWNVAPGHIAFSHTGYQTGTIKKAFASDLTAKEFTVINSETGQNVLTKSVQELKTRLGEFQVMDFSEIREPGSYMIRTGNSNSRSFRIDNDVWRETIWKAINFFYVERCGAAIPGVHTICHRDWTVEHNGKRIVINGGWHDAGDLSQGLVNTSEAVYAMFSLADRLQQQNGPDILSRRLIEEAKWGLEWINKSTFGDGYRFTWGTLGLWTNGILGDNDDITAQAQNSPHENFQAAAAEALAARILKESDPELASDNLKLAKADFQFALAGMKGRGSVVESASIGVLAAINLFQTTGQIQIRDEARRLGKMILDSQQRSVLPGFDIPITGFFYTSPAKDRLQQYNHRGHEQAAITALAKLCDTFTDDPDWIHWYSGVVLHSEYFQKTMAGFTEPYRMLPNSVHNANEYLSLKDPDRENVRQQVLNGIKVGNDWYVRVYAVQPQGTFRGNYGTMLSQAKAISTAARLRRSLDLAELAEDQLHWVVGRNPFSQSTMYGEGYDYQQQYSAMSGDIVGSLPVGIKSRENFDLPYWPAHNHPNYKEVWVHPVSRWIALMEDLAGPAVVDGYSGNQVNFQETKTGKIVTVEPDKVTGMFRVTIPEGNYSVKSGTIRRNLVVLPATRQHVDLRPSSALDSEVSYTTDEASGTVTIQARVDGSGTHRFDLLADNLTVAEKEKEVNVSQEKNVRWQATITDRNAPWVAIIIKDKIISDRQELTGILKPLH